MGFLNGLSASLTGSENAFTPSSGIQEAYNSGYQKKYSISSKNPDNNYGLGTDIASPQDYSSIIDQAFRNLGQYGNDSKFSDIATDYVRNLSNSFVENVYKQTGTAPSADQVKRFVAQNASIGNAQKFVEGQLNPDQINSLAIDYLKGNPDALTTPGTQSAEQQRLGGLADQLNKIYDTGKSNLVSGYDSTVYGPAKTKVVNDLAGQGMLTNPNSRISLDAIEANRGRDLQSGLNTLESNRAAGNIDINKTIEDLLQKNADRSQNSYQFNKTFNASQDNTAYNQGLQRQQLTLADTLGKLQANNNKKDPLDYLNTAINAAGTGAKIASLF